MALKWWKCQMQQKPPRRQCVWRVCLLSVEHPFENNRFLHLNLLQPFLSSWLLHVVYMSPPPHTLTLLFPAFWVGQSMRVRDTQVKERGGCIHFSSCMPVETPGRPPLPPLPHLCSSFVLTWLLLLLISAQVFSGSMLIFGIMHLSVLVFF